MMTIYKNNIAVIGGDLRQVYMANEFIEIGYSVKVYGLNSSLFSSNIKEADSLKSALIDAETVICPIPFTKNQNDILSLDLNIPINDLLQSLPENITICGGNIPNFVKSYCEIKNIKTVDLMELNEVAMLNAIATAEGTISEAITKSNINLHKSNCLILGYGRCGKILAKKLKALDAYVYIAARSKDALMEAEAFGLECINISDLDSVLSQFDFIINTIPSLVLSKEKLLEVSKSVVIIDLASAPGGVDYKVAESLGIKASLCPGLPGKYAPKTSGSILFKAIENIIKGSD